MASIVASLVFVGFQLRQSQQALQADVGFGEMVMFQELMSRVNQSADLADALALARDDPAALTPGQRMKAKAWLEEWLAQVTTYLNLQADGLLDEAAVARRFGNECWVYRDFRLLLDEVRERRDFCWTALEKYCGK